MKKIVATGIFFALALIWLPQQILAQQGCCSWHGGIDYCDTSTGRYVCNDGEYSPSCTCLYIPPTPKPTPPPVIMPPVCKLPGEVYPTGLAKPNSNTFKWDLEITWQAVEGATGYSITSDTNPYSDPGPLSDTTTTSYTFSNLDSGIRYVHIKPLNKCGVNTIKHLKFELAEIIPSPAPTPEPTFTSTPTPLPRIEKKGFSFDSFLNWFRGLFKINKSFE